MPTTFPGAVDVLTNPVGTDLLAAPSHAGQHANLNDAVEAIEATILKRSGVGIAFPVAPAANDVFIRTDMMGQEFIFNGTRWLSTAVYETVMPSIFDRAATWADTFTSRAPAPNKRGGSDLWLVDFNLSGFYIAGGTALSAAHKWDVRLVILAPGGGITAPATFTIDSGAANAWRQGTPGPVAAINGLLGTQALLYVDGTMTGTPGTLSLVASFTYRIVAV